jgi:hypothetical protein
MFPIQFCAYFSSRLNGAAFSLRFSINLDRYFVILEIGGDLISAGSGMDKIALNFVRVWFQDTAAQYITHVFQFVKAKLAFHFISSILSEIFLRF